jgi:hypothetical protein
MMRVRSLFLLVVSISVISLLAGCGGGGGSGPKLPGGFGKIIGTVSDSSTEVTSRALAGAISIEVDGTDISTQAGSDGSFVLNNVPIGMHTLVAQTEGRACAVVVAVEEGQETDVGEMVLSDAGQISGLVTSATTHQPIADALVSVAEMVYTIQDETPHPVRVRHTNASGSYTVSGLPAGEYLVTISKIGYQTVSLQLAVEAYKTTVGDAALQPDPTADVGALAGTVYLAQASGETRPIAGVLVRLIPEAEPIEYEPLPGEAIGEDGQVVDLYPDDEAPGPPIFHEYYAFSDENGAYRIDGVPVGRYTAVAVRPGLVPGHQPVTITANTTTRQDFTLTLRQPNFAVIEGTVTDSVTGSPIQGAAVRAIIGWRLMAGTLGARNGASSEGGVILPDPGHCIMFALTDANGHYTLKTPATVRGVGVRASGYQPKRVEVAVVPGGSITVNVELTPDGFVPKYVLSGRVYRNGEDGASVPIAGAVVAADPFGDDPTGVIFDAVTNEAGEYRMELVAARFRVQAFKEGFRSDQVELNVTEDTVQNFLLTPVEVSPEPPPPPP